ncbi:MAG TPA: hypothetical protein VEA69_14500 [Tepidisphaeraceae bacterium]|nr:hypothetical protein [Tepidisphaeraceae bacterium]
MDPLVNAAVNFTQARTMARVQMAVAAKVMDMERMQGDAAVQLIQAASSGVAKSGDALVAAATGLGGQLDVYG